MQLIISGRGVVLSTAFKDAVTAKVAKLTPLLPALVEARAMCSAEKFRRTVRLTVASVFSAAATSADLGAAVDAAVASLAHQVRRAKDRRHVAGRRLARAVQRRPAGEAA